MLVLKKLFSSATINQFVKELLQSTHDPQSKELQN